MKKRIISLLLSVAISGVYSMSAVKAEQNEKEYSPEIGVTEQFENYTGRYIVKYKNKNTNNIQGTVINDAFALAKNEKENIINSLQEDTRHNKEKKEKIKRDLKKQGIKESNNRLLLSDEGSNSFEINGEKYELIQLNEAVEPDSFAEKIEDSVGSAIEYIQPDYAMSLSNESTEESEFSIELNNIEMNENTHNTEDVTVAVIDTGIDMLHPSLSNKFTEGYNFCDDTQNINIDTNSTADIHGTHIAGIITSNAPNAKIMPLKVFEDGKAYTSDIIMAIEFAKDNGADIVNCSWGGNEYNKALEDAMNESGLLFVCAAGNGGRNLDTTPVYPACFELDNIISVGAVNDNLSISGFSNFGQNCVDIAANGRDIYSTYINNEYGIMSGTSASAGFVSAAAAVCAGLNEFDIKQRILNSADKVSCLEDKVNGGKYLNMENILGENNGRVIDIYPEPDIDTDILKRTDEENWNLYSLVDNVKIAASEKGMYILKSDGNIWVYFGESRSPVQMPTIKNIVEMSDDGYLLIDNQGKAYTWCGMVRDDYTDSYYYPEELTGISNAEKAYSNGSTYFIICSDGTSWGWGSNVGGQAGGTEINGYVDENGIFIDEGYKDVFVPGRIENGSKRDMLTIDWTTYILSPSGELSMMGARNRSFDVNIEGFSLTDNIAGLAKTSKHELVLIYNDGTVVCDQYGDSYRKDIAFMDFQINNLEDTKGNVVIHDGGKADFLDYESYYPENGSGYEDIMVLNRAPLDNVKYVVGGYGDQYLAIKNDDTVWGWHQYYAGSYSQPEKIHIDGEVGVGRILISEQYNNPSSSYYRMSQSMLEKNGWSEQEETNKNGNSYQSAANGNFTAESGKLIVKKTANGANEASPQALIYGIDKVFTYREDNWMGDENVSMWTQNFKGRYGINLKGAFKQNYSQVYYDILGKTNTGASAVVGRYRVDAGANGHFSVYNNKLNGANTNRYYLWQDSRIERKITTYINSFSGTFRTHLNDSGIAAKTTVEGAYPKDEFSMTDWNPKGSGTYITGIRITGQKQETNNSHLAEISELELVEYEDTADNVNEVAKTLTMSYLTDTPNAVRENLKALPSEMNGIDITWTSGNMQIMSNSGQILSNVVYDTNVTMTARITDPADGFTKYLDFKLRLVKPNGVGERFTKNETGAAGNEEQLGSAHLSSYPKWTFSYPGVDNGKGENIHSAQILSKDGYMIFKKISDRQTDSYNECLVGRRYLSYDGDVYSFRGNAELKVVAKAKGTGTFRFAPETLDGAMPFTIILDASNKKVSVVYSERNAQVIQDLNIDPRIDHEYKINMFRGSFTLHIDGKIALTEDGSESREYLPVFTNHYNISKLKAWITNITMKDTEIGFLKSVVYTPLESYDTEEEAAIWKDIEWIYKENIIPSQITADKLEYKYIGGVSRSDINYYSGNYDLIDSDGNVFFPSGLPGGGYTTICTKLNNGNASLDYIFGVHVPNLSKIRFTGLNNGAKKDDIVAVNINVKNASDLADTKFIVSYDSDKLELEDACMFTIEADKKISWIAGTEVVVTKIYDGKLEFVMYTDIRSKLLSTTLNALKFKSKTDGDKEIQVMVKE